MSRVARVSRRVGNHLSDRQKRAIKAWIKRYLPANVVAKLQDIVRRQSSSRPVLSGRSARVGADDALERALNKRVTSISRALWMGFTTDAVADLENIRRTGPATSHSTARAAEALARWYATTGHNELALERIIHANALDVLPYWERLRVLEHHLLSELDLTDGATRLYETWGADSPDLRLMQANLWLRQAQTGKMSREEADQHRLELIDWTFRQNSLVAISDLMQGVRLDFAALQRDIPPSEVPEQDGTSPVVTVIVPAYNAEDTLAVSVNSLRAQTLAHVEILIVDDASTDNTSTVAKDLASRDPRVRVVQHDANRGAYAARNTGLANASGEFATVHDADDWSHPQLLERQVDLLRDSQVVGTFSRLARVTPDLKFLLRPYRPMLEPIHWNYTSLLVGTETLRTFGGWDAVRAHADSELIERLRSHYGKKSLVEVDASVPLSFFLVTGENLTESSSTTLRSVDFGLRKEYSEQARFWRTKTFGDGAVPTLSGHERSGAKQPFYCGRALAQNRDALSTSYDLIIGSDLALTGGTRRCNLAYLDCARRLGLRVGIFNMPRYLLRGSGTIDPAYRELFDQDGIDLLVPGDEASAGVLLVHHPPVLRHAFDSLPKVAAERHYVLVNQLPFSMKDRTDIQYEPGAVRGHYRDAFGSDPTWIPISPRVRHYLAGEVPPDLMHKEDWLPIVGWDIDDGFAARKFDAAPVVGRHSRDHETKWPEEPEALGQAYLAGSQYDVRLLGGVKAAETVLGYRPKNWTVHPFDSVSVRDFLEQIDFFVHFHHSMYIEEFGRNIAEAMADGVVCVLPPEYAETFSDAALYAEPNEVSAVVERAWADRSVYENQVERGARFVQANCSPEVGMKRIASLLG